MFLGSPGRLISRTPAAAPPSHQDPFSRGLRPPASAIRRPASRIPGKLSSKALLTCHKCLLTPPPSVVIITHWPGSTTTTSQGEQLSTGVDIAVYKPIYTQLRARFFLHCNLMALLLLLLQANQAQRKGLCIKGLFSTFPSAFLSALQAFSSLPKREMKSIG